MDQFMKLPPGQKAAVLAAILAVIGLGMYFLLVDPQMGRAAKARADLVKTEKELKDLQAAASPEELAKLHKQRDELEEKNKESKKMLPSTEEVPDFIDSVQGDAKAVGLQVKRFERLAEQGQDLYTSIPIRMVVEGKMLDLVRFMRIYSGNDRRVIHLRDLSVETIPPEADAVKRKMLQTHGEMQQSGGRGQMTPEEKLLAAIEEADLTRELSQVRATFTAYAFTWTGKPAPAGIAAPVSRGVKKRT